jgi:hypothetical protein
LATLELAVVLEAVLRTHTLAPAPGPPERVRLAGITLIPARGGRVVLRRRTCAGAARAAPTGAALAAA